LNKIFEQLFSYRIIISKLNFQKVRHYFSVKDGYSLVYNLDITTSHVLVHSGCFASMPSLKDTTLIRNNS